MTYPPVPCTKIYTNDCLLPSAYSESMCIKQHVAKKLHVDTIGACILIKCTATALTKQHENSNNHIHYSIHTKILKSYERH